MTVSAASAPALLIPSERLNMDETTLRKDLLK
jgi:hypothetical protein